MIIFVYTTSLEKIWIENYNINLSIKHKLCNILRDIRVLAYKKYHKYTLILHKKLCALFDILSNYYKPLFFPFHLMWSIPVLVVYEHQVNKFQTLYLEAARGHLEAVNLAKTHSRWNKHPILLYICNVKSITRLKKGSI